LINGALEVDSPDAEISAEAAPDKVAVLSKDIRARLKWSVTFFLQMWFSGLLAGNPIILENKGN
jgi:hypothetical protein